MANTCFICRVNGSSKCDGPCGGCEVPSMCPGFDTSCRKSGCTGEYRNYGRTGTDFITACNTCGSELEG